MGSITGDVADNVKFGTFRVDYLKFKVPLPVEEVKKWKDVWLAVMDDGWIARGEKHTASVASDHRLENGDYLYSFEAWGPVCSNVVELPFDQWAKWLYRIDVRRECDVTQAGLDEAYKYLREHVGDRRQVNQFDTPERSKRSGRHGGGMGVQVGSHKSDFRIIVYKKTREPGAIEVNLSGDLLKDLKASAMSMRKTGSFGWASQPWRNLVSSCETRCRAKVEYATGMRLEELGDVASGMTVVQLSEEQRLAEIDEHLDRLTLTGMASVYETLQARLFPHEG